MAITKKVIQRELVVREDGTIHSHETHVISDQGVVMGEYGFVRTITLEEDVSGDTELVKDVSSGFRSAKRLARAKEKLQKQ